MAIVQHAAVGRVQIDPAVLRAPGIAGDGSISDGDIAIGRAEIDPAEHVSPGIGSSAGDIASVGDAGNSEDEGQYEDKLCLGDVHINSYHFIDPW